MEITVAEIKISHDQGATWERKDVDMTYGIDESGLSPGDNIYLAK